MTMSENCPNVKISVFLRGGSLLQFGRFTHVAETAVRNFAWRYRIGRMPLRKFSGYWRSGPYFFWVSRVELAVQSQEAYLAP